MSRRDMKANRDYERSLGLVVIYSVKVFELVYIIVKQSRLKKIISDNKI